MMLPRWGLGLVISVILLGLIPINLVKSQKSDPDEFQTPQDYITSKGYIAEIHHVVTKDGYILGVHRIYAPRYAHKPRKAVIIQHGLLLSSMVFIISSPGGGIEGEEIVDYDSNSRYVEVEYADNLGFLLADYGYDVWLPNSRGNTYSTNHTKLNPFKDKRFWEFSFQEMAQKDLPAVVGHIQRVTGQLELSYIGHSQGCLQAFILLAEKPEYSQILKPIIMLAPVLDVTTIKDQARLLIESDELARDLRIIGGPVFPHTSLLDLLPGVICSEKVHYICENVVTIFGGVNLPQLNITRLPVYFSYVPAGTSATNIIHYHQAVKSGTRYFDHGEEINKLLYGTPKPPEIPWGRINSPYIAIFYGENDLFAGPEEIATAKKLIKSE
ncbi:putative lysosomal acid lipase/cholesteryl ester hydrolase [Brevipalpus obovatus]|uniref:putative lysosomal acid lipase/cholesteryl ester hydrolase n=1 Tax=Brevipalpus obovatus TaxID=246614 RepID=UPI003D9F774F